MRIFISSCIALAIITPAAVSSAEPNNKERTFIIEERILLKNLPKETKGLQVWVPYPVNDNCQTIEDFKLDGPFSAKVIEDREYGNKALYLNHAGALDLDKDSLEISVSFKVDRRECDFSDSPKTSGMLLSRLLKADRLVPVNGKIKKLAGGITQGKEGDMAKVRAIYDYIIDELVYSKDDPKICGIGDSLLTLEHKKGICSDYHSLFISLVRSIGIPAKFEIGLPVPQDKASGDIKGYHCWAKFYLKDKGWIPVDVSEADKHPQRRDYFFGHIDENRVHLTTGRDINLKYSRGAGGRSLNFFVWPYAELNGSRFSDVEIQMSFKNLKGGG